MNKLIYGLEMEAQGAKWLESKYPSLSFLEKNYRWKGGEIDLIYEERTQSSASVRSIGQVRELVFVEVRARKPGALVDAVLSITAPKQRRLSRTIQHYLARYRGSAKSARFDVLAWDGLNWSHLKNVRLEPAPAGSYH